MLINKYKISRFQRRRWQWPPDLNDRAGRGGGHSPPDARGHVRHGKEEGKGEGADQVRKWEDLHQLGSQIDFRVTYK